MNFGWILLAHWIGDFVLQGTRMALLKGERFDWLGYHVLVYSLPVWVSGTLLFGGEAGLAFSLINAAAHFVTDAISSRINNRFRDKPRIFFLVIGTDQLLHLLVLYYTYWYYSENLLPG